MRTLKIKRKISLYLSDQKQLAHIKRQRAMPVAVQRCSSPGGEIIKDKKNTICLIIIEHISFCLYNFSKAHVRGGRLLTHFEIHASSQLR